MKTKGGMRAVWRELTKLRKALEAHAQIRTLLTIQSAAHSLSLSQKTVRRMVATGEVVTVRIGTRVLVPVSEVQRLATPAVPPNRNTVSSRRATRRVAMTEAEKLRAAR